MRNWGELNNAILQYVKHLCGQLQLKGVGLMLLLLIAVFHALIDFTAQLQYVSVVANRRVRRHDAGAHPSE